jgi:branched-subunit amino acid aminotransferase/4-amino-4-deoxychorismate lyase
MLMGTGMQVLQRELTAAGVSQEHRRVLLGDLGSFGGAFVTNSWGVAPVSRIDDLDIPLAAPLSARVLELYANAPWDVV